MILKASFTLPNGGEIVISEMVNGKLTRVSDCLPNWQADGKSEYVEKKAKPKKKSITFKK